MVGDHHTSERVYARLKADLLDRYRSIERLNINAMAQRYEASATPVREALLRLVGERIVEMPVSGGFALPDIDIKVAGDCYALGLALALVVMDNVRSAPPPLPLDLTASRLQFPIDAILAVLAKGTGNDVMLSAVRSLNDRMHPIRLMEEMRLPGMDTEFANIVSQVEQYHASPIRRSLTRYYRRRQRSIGKILGISA